MSPRGRWCGCGLALAVWAAGAGAQTAAVARPEPTRSAEQQAEAVRRALLNESLSQPLRVVSTAWIDEQGRLHENAQFTSDMRVRGVRVSSYLQAGEEAEAQVQVDTGAASVADCGATAAAWRRPAQVAVRLGEAFAPGDRALASALAAELGAVLRTQVPQQAWLARDASWQPATRYQTFLLGPGAPPEPWTVELSLSPVHQVGAAPEPSASARVALQRWGVLPQQAAWTVRLQLRWVDRQQAARSQVWHEDVAVQSARPLADAHAAVALARQQLHAALRRGTAALERILNCEPVVVSLAPGEGGFQLPLGAEHGVRAGDRVVMMDRAQLPERVLEPQALQSLGIAEVRTVDAHSARLQWLAGPPPAAARDWVALPVQAASRR
jgi:hypothetical protein